MAKIINIILIILLLIQIGNAQDIYLIKKLPFNTTKSSEISPAFYKNGLVFCSNKLHPFLLNYKDTTKERLYNIYNVQKRDSNKWEIPRILSHNLTTPFNEGALCFTKDYNKVFFTRNISVEEQEGNTFFENGNIGIFISELENEEWTEPILWEHSKSEHNSAHPCLSYDEKLLFFASDMQGGFGGSDIYVSKFENGKWSKPENLGAKVNTVANEYFPFYHESGRLYFSSNRENGVGGFDIYYSSYIGNEWKKAILLNRPLNSVHNDFSLICDQTQEFGYFSSNRDESDDIYSFKMNLPLFDNCDTLQKNNYCFTFFETGNYDLDTMPLRYEWDIAGLKKVKGLEADHCFDGEGEYQINLNIIDTLTSEIFYNQASYSFAITDITQVYINAPDTFANQMEIEFDGLQTNIKDFEISEYYWDFGDGIKAVGVKTKHQYSEEGKYTIQLGVKGDNKTRCVLKDILIINDYKMPDTTQLVNNIKVNKTDRLKEYEKPELKEFGKEQDILEDKTYKVEVARTEEKMSLEDEYFDALRNLYAIMENYVSSDSVYSYTVGNETNITNIYPVFMTVKKAGYINTEVKSFDIIPDSITVNDSIALILLNNLLSKWKSIHFDYGEYKISADSYDMLNKVYNVLNKYSSLIIEIAAHTDDVGPAGFNQELSDKRADAVTQYLIDKGIDKERLIPKGYGKTKPLSLENTEQARSINRRVEFIVIDTGMN